MGNSTNGNMTSHTWDYIKNNCLKLNCSVNYNIYDYLQELSELETEFYNININIIKFRSNKIKLSIKEQKELFESYCKIFKIYNKFIELDNSKIIDNTEIKYDIIMQEMDQVTSDIMLLDYTFSQLQLNFAKNLINKVPIKINKVDLINDDFVTEINKIYNDDNHINLKTIFNETIKLIGPCQEACSMWSKNFIYLITT